MQGKSGWEKQKEEEAKEEAERKREEKEKKKIRKKGKTMVSGSSKVDFVHFIFSLFIFSFAFLLLLFSIFRTTQVRGYQSRCHISHNLIA